MDKPELYHVQSAQGWLELGNPHEAHADLDQLGAEWQAHPEVLKLRIEGFVAQMRWEQALEKADKLIEAAPEDPLGWFHRSYCLHELNRTREARDNLLQVIDKFPSSATVRYNLACYECQLGRLDQARHWLRQACETGGRQQVQSMALQDPDLEPLWNEIRSGG